MHTYEHRCSPPFRRRSKPSQATLKRLTPRTSQPLIMLTISLLLPIALIQSRTLGLRTRRPRLTLRRNTHTCLIWTRAYSLFRALI